MRLRLRLLLLSITLLVLSPAFARDDAPPWVLKTAGGETVRFPEDAQGQPVVLLFWPSWCPYSRALQPYVQDIWEDYRDLGVKVWTINILERGDPLQAMRERGLSFPLLLAGDALVGPYGINRTPWFLVIDGQGRIVYRRPPDAPSPIVVAEAARKALNALLGERAVPLPTRYPPPYDLHLRPPQPSRQAADAVSDAEWLPWAERTLSTFVPAEPVDGLDPQGPVPDGKTAIGIARALWTQRHGEAATRAQAPYRAYRRGPLWLVVGTALPGRLGEGFVLVLRAEDGRVLRLEPPAR